MRQALVVYRAGQLAESRGPRRCCTDEPPVVRRSRRSTMARRARKIRTSAPVALRVFRQGLRLPQTVVEQRRTPVLVRAGRRVGHVHDVVIELGTGRTLYAVAPAKRNGSGPDPRHVLVPAELTEVGDGGSTIVLDDRRLAPTAREQLLAS